MCALAAACATAGGRAGADSARGASTYDVLVGSDLEAAPASNLYEAIRQLRPEILTGHRRGAPDVYIGAARQPSGLERLKQLPVSTVAEVRYVAYEHARSLAGVQSRAGAIVVTLQ